MTEDVTDAPRVRPRDVPAPDPDPLTGVPTTADPETIETPDTPGTADDAEDADEPGDG